MSEELTGWDRKAKDESLCKRFGARLRELREARGISQSELARRIGVRQQAANRYESGTREPALGIVLALAAALKIRPGKLIEGLQGDAE